MQLSDVTIGVMRCEYLLDPIGIDEPRPRLSWKLRSQRRCAAQSAYQIIASTDPADLVAECGPLWDTGKVSTDQSTQVVYAGPAMQSGQRVYWKVRIWDEQGAVSAWSDEAYWEMGLLKREDWKANWITALTPYHQWYPVGQLTKTFPVAGKIKSARLYITALGLYVPFVNGRRVGVDYFRPGWTEYTKRVQYQTYDVTRLLNTGNNALGLLLGEGWYCGHVGFNFNYKRRDHYGEQPRAMAQLVIELADGTRQIIGTDNTWNSFAGPIQSSDFLLGETYDAREETPGWALPGFKPAEPGSTREEKLDQHPIVLVARPGPAVRRYTELSPISITPADGGTFIVDLGQNMVGNVQLKVTAPAGTIIRLRYAEMLNTDGSFYTTNYRSAKSIDTYISKGGGIETWEPTFTFHGFRYVQVTGYPGTPTLDAITGIVLTSDTPGVGSFECSDPMVNQLYRNITWGQRGNFVDIPTDCPQRDERLGWMGDAQIFIRTSTYNCGVAAFFTKWMIDVLDAQSSEGGFADVSPRLCDMADGAPAWGDAGVIVPWTMYQVYGDVRILERCYDAMAKWVHFIHEKNPDLLWIERRNNNFGDWLSIDADTPKEVLSTAYFALSTRLVGQAAAVLGKHDDARKYEELFEGIREAFNKAFVETDGQIKGHTQTGYVLALRFDLLSSDRRAQAAKHLADDIAAKKNHLSTGFLGVGHLLPALTEINRLDLAYSLLHNESFPSWGYSIKHGATTIWERWDGWTQEKGFQTPGMNSFNHYALGSVGEWLFETVAGIDVDSSGPGFKHAVCRPRPGGKITSARASYDSAHGRFVSDWKLENGQFTWELTVPPNATATAFLPTNRPQDAKENGQPLAQSQGISHVQADSNAMKMELQAGTYRFTASMLP